MDASELLSKVMRSNGASTENPKPQISSEVLRVSRQVDGRQPVSDNWLGTSGVRYVACDKLLMTSGADNIGGRQLACDSMLHLPGFNYRPIR